jgi:acetyl-CoA carboxylase biotin carboxyl carrier protein
MPRPFVQKGSTVKAGDTLLIIEAMKVMNPIKAEKGGTITHIMIENGKPVEYGDVLMVIE